MLVLSIFIVLLNQNVFATSVLSPSIFSQMYSKALSSGYGPYYLHTYEVKLCNSTKKNPNTVITDKTYVKLVNGELIGNFTIPADSKLSAVCMNIAIWKNNSFEQIYERYSHNPCKDVIFKVVLNLLFKSVGDSCVIKKGLVKFPNLNINDVAHAWATQFFYERATMSIDWISKQESMFCIWFDAQIKPLNKSKTT